MIDPGDAIGQSPRDGRKMGSSSKPWGCSLPGLGLTLFVLICCCGLGLPSPSWNYIDHVQVLEGPDRVSLFVEVMQANRAAGLIGCAQGPVPRKTILLIQIDVFPD